MQLLKTPIKPSEILTCNASTRFATQRLKTQVELTGEFCSVYDTYFRGNGGTRLARVSAFYPTMRDRIVATCGEDTTSDNIAQRMCLGATLESHSLGGGLGEWLVQMLYKRRYKNSESAT